MINSSLGSISYHLAAIHPLRTHQKQMESVIDDERKPYHKLDRYVSTVG